MSKKKRKTTKWIKFARVLIAIQAILSIIVTGMVIKTQMLPAKFPYTYDHFVCCCIIARVCAYICRTKQKTSYKIMLLKERTGYIYSGNLS